MVIRREQAGTGFICIPQRQHAAVAGQIARAWGNVDFPVPSPQQAVCLAAERHDDGMDEFDSDPERDAETGLPRDFMRMPLGRWIECWERGPEKVGEENPYAGILVSMHGLHLLGYRQIEDSDEEAKALVEDFRQGQQQLQERLRKEAREISACEPHMDDGTLSTNQKLIAAWDAISLAICVPRTPETVEGVPIERREMTIHLSSTDEVGGDQTMIEVEPWPFSGDSVPLAVAGRYLADRSEDQAELDEAFAAASVRTLNFTLVPKDRGREPTREPAGEMPV